MGGEMIAEVDCRRCCKSVGIKKWPYCRNLWIVKDCCGWVCAVFTWLLVLYACFAVNFVMLIPHPDILYKVFNMIIFNASALLAVVSHFRAMTSDPGAVPKGNATKENIMKLQLKEGQVVFRCPKCSCIKPERAHHCSICRRCIRKMDHHCPWVNNCVGEFNQKFFILFTLYIFVISAHAIYMSAMHFIYCLGGNKSSECSTFSTPATTVFLIILIFEGLLFGIFTAIMCGTQIYAVCTDETGIEALKGGNPSWEKKSGMMALRSMFGQKFGMGWLNPFTDVNSHEGKEKPYMYLV